MLDTETKRRIDTARDILVGKVPDPKSQVEQITIALIYKFMDDMDAEAEELGGKRKFFTGDYARYGWAKLMDRGLGGHEMLALYAEGITKMPENPGIPLLFREIFKNAFLPYRDPETLKAFLKTIDEFSYDHSERLGDAFEYLLSVLGSQGDAGQFRTPRHIIDFMVAVVDPRKTETVLDPACGTAGFLISSYKHILRANAETPLTPDERGRLALNFKGYDISPDMVRLSLVNLYLHGFTDPHIYEYDTLTSEERWNEYADVILANPPFMSPKGGIKPHKRFSIQAKRSEVLFVDYMAEHLTPAGRAAIIVPEGIIFQSQTAYKDLRRMLVENYLVAVVSLPAGCFNPYSGVKTSILILDKSLARQSQTVAFFKVENDGFGLGAQRRAIEKNDLPQVQAELTAYLQALRSGQAVDESQPSCGLIVPKEKIAANGDYNLSGERYREGSVQKHVIPMVRLGEICSLGGTITTDVDLTCPYFGADSIEPNTGKLLKMETAQSQRVNGPVYAFDGQRLLYSKIRPYLNKLTVVDLRGYCSSDMYPLLPDASKVHIRYLAAYMLSNMFNDRIRGYYERASIPKINRSQLFETEIPLPPLEVQKEIVAEIEGYQKVINGARAILDHYRPHIPIHPDWPMAAIGSVCEIGDGNHSSTYPKASEMVASGVPFIRGTNLVDGRIDPNDMRFISSEKHVQLRKGHLKTGDVIFTNRGEIGKVAIVDERFDDANLNSQLAWLRAKDGLLPTYLLTVLQSSFIQDKLHTEKNGATLQQYTVKQLTALEIPLPPLATQQAIVAEIEAEQALVAANRELIARFERKIQATLARIWGEEESTITEA